MAKKKKLLKKILSGSKNIRFDDFINLLEAFGFTLERVGGNHMFSRIPYYRGRFPSMMVRTLSAF